MTPELSPDALDALFLFCSAADIKTKVRQVGQDVQVRQVEDGLSAGER